MSLRQALKRSLAAISDDAPTQTPGQTTGLGAAVPASLSAIPGLPVSTATTLEYALPGGAAVKKARRAGAQRRAGAHTRTGAAGGMAAPMPEMELEIEREDEDEDADMDDEAAGAQDAVSDEDEPAAAPSHTHMEDVAKPLKKRIAAAAAGEDAPGHAAAAAAAPLFEDVDAPIPDFDDGYGSDLMGDEQDRMRLASMAEIDREKELMARYDRRLLGQQNIALRRQLQAAEKAKRAAGLSSAPGGAAAAAPLKKRFTARADEAAAAAEAPIRTGRQRRGGAVAARGGAKARAKPVARDSETESGTESDTESSSSGSESDSSASSSSGASSSSSGSTSSSEASSASSAESEGIRGGRRRLRAARGRRPAAGRAAAADSDFSEDEEESPRAAAAERARKKKEAERRRKMYGTDEEESSGGEDGLDISVKATKAAAGGGSRTRASGGLRGTYAVEEGDDTDFEDEDAADGTAVREMSESLGAAHLNGDAANDIADATLDDVLENAFVRRHNLLGALDKPYLKDYAGAFVRVRQPVSGGRPGQPAPAKYRIARIVGFLHFPKRQYNPWKHVPTQLLDKSTGRMMGVTTPILMTDLYLHIGFGSSKESTAPDGSTLPRAIRLDEISEEKPTSPEWIEYVSRLTLQFREGGQRPDDRLPTRRELRQWKESLRAKVEGVAFTAQAVDEMIAQADKYLEHRLSEVVNLTLERDRTIARLATVEARMQDFAGDAPDAVLARQKLEAERDRLQKRVQAIADEEASRRAASREAEKRRLAQRRDVSALTKLVNAKVMEENRRHLEWISETEKAQQATQAAIDDGNAFARRTTMPAVLWKAPADLLAKSATGATTAAPAAAPASAAPTPAAPAPAAAPGLHAGEEHVDIAPVSVDAIFSAAALPSSAATVSSPPQGPRKSAGFGSPPRVNLASSSADAAASAPAAGGKKALSLAELKKRVAAAVE